MITRDADAVMVRELYAEPDGTVVARLHQPSRQAILEHNARSRIEHPRRELTFGRLVLNIPLVDRERLRATHPELDAPDAETRRRAWLKFITSAEALPFKV